MENFIMRRFILFVLCTIYY